MNPGETYLNLSAKRISVRSICHIPSAYSTVGTQSEPNTTNMVDCLAWIFCTLFYVLTLTRLLVSLGARNNNARCLEYRHALHHSTTLFGREWIFS